MRLTIFITLCLLMALFLPDAHQVRLGSKRRPNVAQQQDDPYDQFETESLSALDYKYMELRKLVSYDVNKPLMEFTQYKFDKFIVQTPRNYTMILLLSDMPGIPSHCVQCRSSRIALNSVARAYYESVGEYPSIFFGEVLSKNSPEVFSRLGVPMDHLPVIFAIPAQGSLTNLKEMNKIMYQFTVKSLINWIHATTGISIQQKPAIEHTTTNSDNRELTSLSWFSKLFVKLWPYIFPLYCLYVKRQTIMESLAEWQNPSYIAKFLISLVIVFTSGYMFCSIENAPLFGRNYEGNFMLIYPATGRQFTIEVIIVFVLYAVFVYGFIQLIELRKNTYQGQNQEELKTVGAFALGCVIIPLVLILNLVRYKIGSDDD